MTHTAMAITVNSSTCNKRFTAKLANGTILRPAFPCQPFAPGISPAGIFNRAGKKYLLHSSGKRMAQEGGVEEMLNLMRFNLERTYSYSFLFTLFLN